MRLFFRYPAPTILALSLILCAGACRPAPDVATPIGPTTVVVVRHAEKAADGADPSLLPEGVARAEALKEVLAGADVAAVYSTPFLRTRATAAPTAEALGLQVTITEVANLETHPAEVAARVLAEHRGETVLVVGHSNTVPAIVEALGGGAVAPITDAEYSHLFIVIIPASGPVRTIKAQYGKG